jgi:hypothetical protein
VSLKLSLFGAGINTNVMLKICFRLTLRYNCVTVAELPIEQVSSGDIAPVFGPPTTPTDVCEADHSLPSSAEVKNGGAIPPLPHYVFMIWCVII